MSEQGSSNPLKVSEQGVTVLSVLMHQLTGMVSSKWKIICLVHV